MKYLKQICILPEVRLLIALFYGNSLRNHHTTRPCRPHSSAPVVYVCSLKSQVN